MPNPVVGSRAFLNAVQQFNKKCASGTKIPAKEARAFHQIITATKSTSIKKDYSPSATTFTNASIREKTLTALEGLLKTLGNNTAFIKSAAPAMKQGKEDDELNAEIEEALTKLVRYVNEQKKESAKVARKETDHLSSGQ